MAQRKSFLLRLPPELMEELARWAKDDLRSVNAQIEFVLREALRRHRKSVEPTDSASPQDATGRNRG